MLEYLISFAPYFPAPHWKKGMRMQNPYNRSWHVVLESSRTVRYDKVRDYLALAQVSSKPLVYSFLLADGRQKTFLLYSGLWCDGEDWVEAVIPTTTPLPSFYL